MKNPLFPLEIAPGEWIIKSHDGYEKYGYEEFSNRTYPSRAACQKTIDTLNVALPDLLIAAEEIINCWQGGDLAAAVRNLDRVLKTAWGTA